MKKLLLVSFLAGIISGGLYLVFQPKEAECNSCGYCSQYYDGCYTNCACLLPKIGSFGKCVSTRSY